MNSCDHETEVCPYDKSHMIVKSRMLTHLARCSKNFPDCEKKPCLYNNKHVIPVPELKYHHENCPDRLKIDLYKMKVGDVECPVKEEAPIAIELPPSEENWDEDPPVSGSVLEKIKDVTDKNVLLTTTYIGKSKRQRKDLRRQEVLRHAQLNSNKKVDEKPFVDQSPVVSSSTSDKKNFDTNPIRLPKELTSISGKIHQILQNKESSMKSESADSSIKEVPVTSVSKDSTSKLSEDIKLKLKISSRTSDDCSVSSRHTEPASKSYASFVAQHQKEKTKSDSGKAKSLNNIDVCEASGKDSMQILKSSIFEKGPRGRGRSINISSPSSVSSHSSTPFSSLTSDFDLLTDEHGFLDMPVPGKGRGKVIPQ